MLWEYKSTVIRNLKYNFIQCTRISLSVIYCWRMNYSNIHRVAIIDCSSMFFDNCGITWNGTFMLKFPSVDTEPMSHHLLCGLHYVPTTAVVQMRSFLRLLTEVNCLIHAFAELTVKGHHERVRHSRPVRMACMSVVTVVMQVAVTLQQPEWNHWSIMWSMWKLESPVSCRQKTVALII